MRKNESQDKQPERKITAGVAMYPSLKERLENAAKEDGRSFSDFICRALDKALSEPQQD